jgi:NADH:ubiquinone oxidoreductase subunit 6 (subunit J)
MLLVLLTSVSPALAASVPVATPDEKAPGHKQGTIILGWILFFVLIGCVIAIFLSAMDMLGKVRGNKEGGLKAPAMGIGIALGIILLVFTYSQVIGSIVNPLQKAGF